MVLSNRTPHACVLYGTLYGESYDVRRKGDFDRLSLLHRLPPDDEPIRATTEQFVVADGQSDYWGVRAVSPQKITGVLGHESLSPGERVLVSLLVAQPLANLRADVRVYSADTGPDSVVRNLDGTIAGVRRLILWTPESLKSLPGIEGVERTWESVERMELAAWSISEILRAAHLQGAKERDVDVEIEWLEAVAEYLRRGPFDSRKTEAYKAAPGCHFCG